LKKTLKKDSQKKSKQAEEFRKELQR